MTFKSLFGPITKLSLSFVTFRVSHFPVLHLTYVTVKLGLQNTLNMSKTTRVYFWVLQGGEHNGVFFTLEHLAAGLRFPLPAIVKQFLHFTRVPPALIHPNVIHILIGNCVLNHLYQLDLTLVELFIIYFLNLGSGGWMSMSVLSP